MYLTVYVHLVNATNFQGVFFNMIDIMICIINGVPSIIKSYFGKIHPKPNAAYSQDFYGMYGEKNKFMVYGIKHIWLNNIRYKICSLYMDKSN